jgi:hypothetical protein
VTCGLSDGVSAPNIGPLNAGPPKSAPLGATLIVSPACEFVASDAVNVRVQAESGEQDEGSSVLTVKLKLFYSARPKA